MLLDVEIILVKTCVKCKRQKPLDRFHKHKRGHLGLDSICKKCSKAKTLAWRAENPGAHAAIQRRYTKGHRAEVHAANKAWLAAHPDYQRERQQRRMKDPEYRRKHKISVKNWGLRNPDKLKRQWRENRARRCGAGPLPPDDVLNEILARPCEYCGKPGGELDHIMPVSRGGSNDESNLASACRSCNAKKSSRTPEEWRAGVSATRRNKPTTDKISA